MTTEKIKINETELRETLTEALKLAEGHPGNFTSGWGYPIYVNEAGKLSIGGMISNNSWQPDAIEVVRVKNWNVEENNDCEFSEDWTREDEVDSVIESDILDHYIMVIEESIKDRNYDAATGEGSGSQFEIV